MSHSQNETQLAVFLGDDTHQLSVRGRRALLHGYANILQSVRYEDIMFRIPGVVPPAVARRARSLLSLSPEQYLENIRELDRQNAPVLEIDAQLQAEALNLVGNDEQRNFWEEYGMAYGEPGWKSAYDAKLAIGRYLTITELQQEQITKELIDRGIRQLHSRWTKGMAPAQTLYKTTQDAFHALYGKKSAGNANDAVTRMLAVHTYMLSDSDHFIADNIEFLASARFRLRAPDELACLQTVREWLRNSNTTITDFVDKCAVLLRAPSVPTAQQWTAEDRTIVLFLQIAMDMKRELQVNPFIAGAGKIIKSIEQAPTDPASGKLSAQIDLLENSGSVPPIFALRTKILELLRRVGILKQHENLVLHDRDLGLKQWSTELQDPKRPSSTTVQAGDALDAKRVDFESLPVYVIDDPGASELDDGISVADAPVLNGKPTSWVHIHIADPTSSLQPNDQLAHLASKRLESVYFPEYTWPMLAFDVIQQHKWSLRSSSVTGNDSSQRAMTFSARIDDEGNVLEQKVQLGSIRNVRTVTYDMVNDLLGNSESAQHPDREQYLEWPIPASSDADHATVESRPARLLSSLDDIAKGDLERLHLLSSKLRRKRVEHTAIAWGSGGSSLSFLGDRSRPPLPVSLEPPRLRLYLASAGQSTADGKAQAMVAEYMVLAGRVAAEYLSKRKIPMTYRGQLAPGASSQQELEELLAMRDPATGLVDFRDVTQRRIVFQPAFNALSPADHWPMGIRAIDGGYVRATSPLRRYSDLLVHWQLKSALAGNAVGPPFSEDEIASVMGKIERVGRARRRLERRSNVFWKIFLLHQKWQEARKDPSEDPDAAELLLGGLPAIVLERRAVTKSLKFTFTLAMPQLGIQGTATLDAAHRKVPAVGEKVTVDIDGIILDEYSKVFVRMRGYA